MMAIPMRVALGVEYDGSAYHGWQIQSGLPTIQSTLESALSQVAAEPIAVVVAGRTDAGVHAYEQVVHFDSMAKRDENAWVLGVNTALPKDIRVLWAKPVSEDFHARFSAICRTYRYVIYTAKTHPALFRRYMAWYRFPLEGRRMQEAADYLIGEHDFSSFRGSDCQARSPIRRVLAVNIEERENLLIFTVKANGFLHHMVRNIVSILIEIGRGRQTPLWMKEVLGSRRRPVVGPCAPPQGLYLQQIQYPIIFNVGFVAPHIGCFPLP